MTERQLQGCASSGWVIKQVHKTRRDACDRIQWAPVRTPTTWLSASDSSSFGKLTHKMWCGSQHLMGFGV